VDASLFTFVIIKFHLASFSTENNQGADINDVVMLSVSNDGGNTYLNEIKITGFNSSIWDFTNNNIAKSSYSGSGVTQEFRSSNTFELGIGNVELKNIPSAGNILFQISLTNQLIQEIWVIDDVELFGL